MSVVEVPSPSRNRRAGYYRTINGFIDSPPIGYKLLFNPLEMRVPTPIQEAFILGVVRGVTMEDAQAWELLEPGYELPGDNGIMLAVRPLWECADILGYDAKFFPPHSPRDIMRPMRGLQLTPSGDVSGVGERRNSVEEDLKIVEAAMGITARAIRQGRLLTPQVYWSQLIAGNDYPRGVSPYVPR